MELKELSIFETSATYGIFSIAKRKPLVFDAFLNLAHEVMHPESAFEPLTRELLGAYVSKQFGCSFCHLGHLETAYAIGGEAVKSLVDNPTDELRPLFALADKVVANAVTDHDILSFLALGYTEKHYEDVVFVCALFGFANRMVTGFGIEYDANRDETSSRYLAKGYRMKN
jgi:alkylhydroperoxidase family enzyme